jgi:DNA mismatch repair protein MutS2
VQNASVEFDVETLSPTYRLSIGLPGRSNALAIASRLGLIAEIIDTARQMISPSQTQVETLLLEIQRDRGAAEVARGKMEAELEAATRLRQEIAAERRAMDDERRRVKAEARAQAEQELQDVRARLRKLMTEAESSHTRAGVAAALQQTKEVADALPQAPGAAEAEGLELGETLTGPVSVGDTVWIPSLNLLGEVLSGPDQQNVLDVQLGSFKTKVMAGEVEKRAAARRKEAPRQQIALAPSPETSLQLDLRGWRAEDVEPALDRYLNDAYLAGMPFVRIVHGKGTGVLRQVVREIVARHSLVKSSRNGEAGEGGDGVTVVILSV